MVRGGSHIKLNHKILQNKELPRTVFHELCHEMHYLSCLLGIAPYEYEEYDESNGEMFAMLAFDPASLSYSIGSCPNHYKATMNLKRLKENPDFDSFSFREKWMFLLGFRESRSLLSYLIQTEINKKE